MVILSVLHSNITEKIIPLYDITVEPLYKGHLGDTRKWPLQRSLNKSHCVWTVRQKGGRCGEAGEVAVSEGSILLLILN